MRKSSLHKLLPAVIMLPIIMLAGCSPSTSGSAVAIESYFYALEVKDLNQMVSLSCAEWEAQARLEYDSFAAVDTILEEIACQPGAEQDGIILVTCEGRIIASYGAEDLIIELNERTYKAVLEGGEWLMCGNQ